MDIIFVGYFTKGSLYEEYARNLVQSLHQFNLHYRVVGVEDLGSWDKNTQHKPTFLKQMLERLDPAPLVYIDVDALVYQLPSLFEQLSKDPTVDIAAHILNHKKFGRQDIESELLSGTLYLANTDNTRQIVDQWIHVCQQAPKLWDQQALAQVLKANKYKGFRELPEQYCVIYDYMRTVVDPVIVHYQASRICRTERPTIKGIKRPR